MRREIKSLSCCGGWVAVFGDSPPISVVGFAVVETVRRYGGTTAIEPFVVDTEGHLKLCPDMAGYVGLRRAESESERGA